MNTSKNDLIKDQDEKCSVCGTPLATGVLAGLCPACMLKIGLAGDTDIDTPTLSMKSSN
jgi:hypothetical protein